MIDTKLLLDDFDNTRRRLLRKNGIEEEVLGQIRNLLLERKSIQGQVDSKRAMMNTASKEIGMLVGSNRAEEAESRKSTLAELKENISALETRLKAIEDRLDYFLLRIPNLPADECPEGKSEDSNVIRSVHDYDEAKYKNGVYRPHWEVATELGIFDAERASKISGSMFSLLRKDGAKLLRALVKLGLDLNAGTYEEILPPHFVRTETFTATGHLPKFEADAYKLRDDELWAIPTGEVPLMSLHRDEILDETELPKRYMAYTVCFRKEAGAAGKDTRGLQRLHEFHKVEMLKLCTQEQVQSEFEAMVADAQRPLQLLGLPYRIVDLCAGDLTFSSARIFDIEVYSPGVDRWLEVSSVGIFTDFQARRGNIRYRRGTEKPKYVHALNGSALATPRVWAAIIEHYQQPDGSVRIPEPLVPFMGKELITKVS